MENLKLGEKERYDIDVEIIKKYNIKVGDVSPFTRLRVIDISIEDDLDIKQPSDYEEIDIKQVSPNVDDEDEIDIKQPSPEEEIDIRKI